MAVMVASKKYRDCLNAFVFGYARMDIKKQAKRVFSINPLIPAISLIIIIITLLWYWLKNKKKPEEMDIQSFMTRRNEGVLISKEDIPGLHTGNKEELSKLIGIAIDKQILENGETPDHIFFLLTTDDYDIFTDGVLEAIGNKHVWIFAEDKINAKTKRRLKKIGKLILFNPDHMKKCGYSQLTLGIIVRFLSLISRDSNTNLDHIFQSIPDICTISFSFPADIHDSLASILKHQKQLIPDRREEVIQVTNCDKFKENLAKPANFVRAETEDFFISFGVVK
jgi:hypothetical protein